MRQSLRNAFLVGAATLAAGCGTAEFKGTRHVEVAGAALAPVRVETENGGIEVVAATTGDRAAAVVDADIRASTAERLAAVKVLADRGADGVLFVRAEWPDGKREPEEGCSFHVAVPGATEVTAKTSNGSIRVEGFSGRADLRTSNGSVTAKGPGGKVLVRTDNGSVEVSGAKGAVDVETSNGRIEVTPAASNPGPVQLKSSNGTIRLVIGRGFLGAITGDTDNGRVDMDTFDGGDSVHSRGGGGAHGRVVARPGGAESTLQTTNGDVAVELGGM